MYMDVAAACLGRRVRGVVPYRSPTGPPPVPTAVSTGGQRPPTHTRTCRGVYAAALPPHAPPPSLPYASSSALSSSATRSNPENSSPRSSALS